jgi:hypothetical protein
MKSTLHASLAALCLVIGQTLGAENEPSLPDNDAYAEAAFRLFALIEGWPGENRVETSRLLAEAFMRPMQERFPQMSKESWRQIADEFQPKLTLAFQNLAAHVCREHFTHDELLDLIRFYESPIGRKYARVYQEIVQRMSAGDQHLSAVVEELRERIHRQLTAPEK